MPISRLTVPSRAPACDFAAAPDNLAGVLWALLSVAAASGMTLAVREAAAAGMDTRMVALIRSVIILIGVAAALPFLGGIGSMRFSRPWLHLWRGLPIALAIQFGFHAIAHLPLATATALFFTAPLFATLISGPLNGEKLSRERMLAAGIGFLGALIVLRPFDAAFEPAMLTALGSSLCFALALALSRGLAQADGALSALVSSTALTAVIGAPVAIPVWAAVDEIEIWLWAALAAVAAFGALRNVADIQSYRVGEAGVVGPVSYLRLVALGALGWALFGERPDAATLLGGVVIVGSAFHLARRQRRAARQAAV